MIKAAVSKMCATGLSIDPGMDMDRDMGTVIGTVLVFGGSHHIHILRVG